MSYGIDATRSGGGFLIDSNTTSTEYLTVIESSTCEAGSTVDRVAGDLIFAKPFNTSSSTQNRVIFNTQAVANKIKFLYKVFYIRLQKAQSVAVPGGAGTYGIQIKNAGGVVIFDSRTATSGTKILSVVNGTTYYQRPQPNSLASSSPTNPQTSLSGRTLIIHSGNPANVYVSCSSGYYDVGGSIDIVLGGFYYDYANNRILTEGFIDLTGTIAGSLDFWFHNWADVMTGELIT
tara:strand:+ start:487 stop:1188 length:702 start_codon:yes stop_codon:yes gene_type:complete